MIVLTGLDDAAAGEAAVEAGAQDYLVKGQVSGALLSRSPGPQRPAFRRRCSG